MAIHKAAASCQSEGQIWDISDPAHPDTLHAVHIDDPGVSFWHSAEFTWDGQYVVFDDESLGNDTCQSGNQGRIRIYRVSDAHLMSSYMIPRPQGNYCSVHNGNLIPVAGRYLLVAAWYFGGTSVIDFTDPSNPHEIAYYDAGGKPDGQRGVVRPTGTTARSTRTTSGAVRTSSTSSSRRPCTAPRSRT